MNFYIQKKDNAEIVINERASSEIEYYDVKIRYDTETIPSPTKFTFTAKLKNLYSVFSSDVRSTRNLNPSWRPNVNSSRLAFNMPMLTAVTREGMNAMTVSLSDTKIPAEISIGMIEESGFARATITLFPTPISATESFEVTVRIDKRTVRYEKAISDTVSWWENECGYTAAPVPNEATLPMNSAWYSYHQEIDVDDIVEECRKSKALGMETLILDDGWQTEDIQHGYAYCGDWEICEKKIPDMKNFVDRIHGVGMKFMLWYSVPYVGIYSKAFERFKDKLLDYDDKKKWFCLDPRFPEVRKYLADIYKNAIINYGLDGFKLDFIDSFKLTSTSTAHNEGRDTESLEDALDMLLSEIYSTLTAINPDVLIEFRQNYVGPTVRKYGNMLRVGDCPADPLRNRCGIGDLRLTSGKTAVHSDMLLWNETLDVEDAAVALVSILYGVAQISVKLAKLPEDHLKMLKFYLSFMRDNRETLLFGSFTADNPETQYSRMSASKNGNTITTLYDRLTEKIPSDFSSYTVVNGTASAEIIIDSESDISGRILNCMGDTVENVQCKSGLTKLLIPKSGMVIFEK
ncbi:MAG: alpha-galactosidase [Clostridia bacterium]|nr:alpha-galactosidase [Clostridia bacterium]